ncbi:MAG: hypothetical protein GY778_19630 [bacterium]|nr:hypothetical protein [bacterium]
MSVRIMSLLLPGLLMVAGCSVASRPVAPLQERSLRRARANRDFVVETVRLLQQQGLRVESIDFDPDANAEDFEFSDGKLRIHWLAQEEDFMSVSLVAPTQAEQP